MNYKIFFEERVQLAMENLSKQLPVTLEKAFISRRLNHGFKNNCQCKPQQFLKTKTYRIIIGYLRI